MLRTIFRQYVMPALVLLVFLLTLVVVSIRSFLPGDMAQPAPIDPADQIAQVTGFQAVLFESM
ncbi:MAG: hypothetical protein HC924_04775 [Synechococcaceae cyanobacterium SM2_3_2]|nr:hypothetical protein [Synechococcaceae cyanobacterium SM2_3_2]